MAKKNSKKRSVLDMLVSLNGESVPLAEADGLPIGVQFVGRFADEGTLFQLAGQLEQAAPWAGRKAKVSAEVG